MNSLDRIADKLRKLICLLSSDNDGEVLGAVHAIRRTLGAEGLDLHALADGINGGSGGNKADGADYTVAWNAGYSAGRAAAEREAPRREEPRREEPSWHDIACLCNEHADRFSDREREFVGDMVRRTVHGGTLTERQANWLRDIYTKVRRYG
jgi:hypothetical protein